jgi:hypothetical protein
MGQGMGEPSDERMPKKVNRLSAVKVASIKNPGFYADGDGLYLQVTDSGSRSWVFRFKASGRTRDMGLGSVNTIGLAEARGMAAECRRQRLQGIDPIEARKSGRVQAQLDAARSLTFDDCRDKFIASHRAAWANDKHLKQLRPSRQECVLTKRAGTELCPNYCPLRRHKPDALSLSFAGLPRAIGSANLARGGVNGSARRWIGNSQLSPFQPWA